MFKRSPKNLPKDPSYPSNLTDLGFKVNDKGEFVKIAHPDQFFDFFHTDNDRANEVRKEAVHECARDTVLAELTKLGIKELYLSGEDGATLSNAKPAGQHTKILTSDVKVLGEKKDVLVVVGEHSQDLGVWAYRSLFRAPGIDGGSAVGLVKKLQALGLDGASGQPVRKNIAQATSVTRTDSVVTRMEAVIPGIIILNPGQRLYSPKLNKTMNHKTWLARAKDHALQSDIEIHPVHNSVPGHTSPEEHITTVFEHVIPQLLGADHSDVRLWIVGITDGAEHFVNYMDAKLAANRDAVIGGAVEAIALMQPTHEPKRLDSEAFRIFLEVYGRSWVLSSQPKGKILNFPSAYQKIGHYTDEDEQKEERRESGATMAAKQHEMSEPAEKDDFDMVKVEPRTEDEPIQTPSQSSPIVIPTRKAGNTVHVGDTPGVHSFDSTETVSLSHSHSLGPTTPPLLFARPPAADNDHPAMHNSINSLNSNATHSSTQEEMEDSHDYSLDTVSCPTFSSGVEDVMELIWPGVMDDVLEWFGGILAQKEDMVRKAGVAGAARSGAVGMGALWGK